MRGLIFNVLATMAAERDCSDEAWDLVMAYVQNETKHVAGQDVCLNGADDAEPFETPAAAIMESICIDKPKAK